MNIHGLTKFTLIDYPQKIASIIFAGNCNFICPYCHNPFLVVDSESQPLIPNDDFYRFLDSRVGKIDAVVISGGEPTLSKGIFSLALEIKKRGFLVKLDTNGSRPKVVRELYENNCLDFIGVDYKGPKTKYNFISGTNELGLYEKITETISYIMSIKISYDIRTTVHKALLSEHDIITMRAELSNLGVKNWILQRFNPTEVIDEELKNIPTYSDIELLDIIQNLPNTQIRSTKNLMP